MTCINQQSTSQGLPLSWNAKKYLRQNTIVQESHAEDEDKLDRAKNQSTLDARIKGRNEPNIRAQGMD